MRTAGEPRAIRGHQAAPANHRDAHDLEVLGADHEEVGHRPARWRVGAACAPVTVAPGAGSKWDEHRVCRGGHAGQRPGGVAQAVLKCRDTFGIAARYRRDRGADRCHTIGLEAWGDGDEVDERPQQDQTAEQAARSISRSVRRRRGSSSAGVRASDRRAHRRGARCPHPRSRRRRARGRPARSAAARVEAAATARTRPSSVTSAASGSVPGYRATSHDASGCAIATPSPPATPKSPRVSVHICRAMRAGVAPSAPRVANSRAPRVCLGEQEVRDVRARDRQQHGDRQPEQQHHRLDRADHRLLQPIEMDGTVAVRVGIGRRQPRRDCCDLVLCRRERGVSAQPADRCQRDRSALVQERRWREGERHPQIGAAGRESIGFRGKHSDDRPALGANLNGAADRGRVAAEMGLPESVPQHDSGRRTEAVVVGHQRPTPRAAGSRAPGAPPR